MATPSKTVLDTDSAGENSLSFESALSELEAIVAAMEAGQMSLQEALDAYKRGSDLLRQCQATLSTAEQQIRILDGDRLRDFDAPQEVPSGNRDIDGKQES
ncbi:MAG: exodeoxyribonuclease VII small subunit [Sulfuritalea sp.]|nr:exodeoxyribonuclease VII small subunit [Sulfuritalea sp.]